MELKKILGWAIVILIAYYLFTKPSGSAGAMQGVFHLLTRAGVGLAGFLTHL